MFEPLFPIINSRGQEHDHHFDDNPEDLIFAAPPKQPNQKPTFWEWVVPAALRDIEVPVVSGTAWPFLDPDTRRGRECSQSTGEPTADALTAALTDALVAALTATLTAARHKLDTRDSWMRA